MLISINRRLGVEKHLIDTGNKIKQIWRGAAEAHGLNIYMRGLPSLAAFAFKSPNAMALNTCFTIELLRRDLLGLRQSKQSLVQQPADLSQYQNAVDEVFALIAANPAIGIDAPLSHNGFQRLMQE